MWKQIERLNIYICRQIDCLNIYIFKKTDYVYIYICTPSVLIFTCTRVHKLHVLGLFH